MRGVPVGINAGSAWSHVAQVLGERKKGGKPGERRCRARNEGKRAAEKKLRAAARSRGQVILLARYVYA